MQLAAARALAHILRARACGIRPQRLDVILREGDATRPWRCTSPSVTRTRPTTAAAAEDARCSAWPPSSDASSSAPDADVANSASSSVVLPTPLAPTIATRLRAPTWSVAPSRIARSPPSVPQRASVAPSTRTSSAQPAGGALSIRHGCVACSCAACRACTVSLTSAADRFSLDQPQRRLQDRQRQVCARRRLVGQLACTRSAPRVARATVALDAVRGA